MLSEYSKEKIVYKQMINALSNNLSHAYLFNANDNIYADEMIMEFVIEILAKDSVNSIDTIRKRVNELNYPDLKIIRPDGMLIKKDQIDELQKLFSTKSIEGNKKVYIIHDVDRFNLSAANAMLKFLEEPSDGIIGILITNKLSNVIKTISSRCQIINFSKNNVEDFLKYNNIIDNITIYKLMYSVWNDTNINNALEYSVFVEKFIKFIKYYNDNGVKSLTKIKEYFFDNFIEKEDVIYFFNCMILFYRDIANYKINNKVIYFDDYVDLINKISNKYDYNEILSSLQILIEKEKLVKSNANINMLIDSLIIEMEEVC